MKTITKQELTDIQETVNQIFDDLANNKLSDSEARITVIQLFLMAKRGE